MTKIGHVPSQAEHEARALADEIIARGASTGASDDDRTNAETATIILQIAEKKSGLVDRSVYEAMLAEIDEWSEAAEAKILAMARPGVPQADIDEAVQRFVAESETKQRSMQAWLERQGVEAWEEAERDLRRVLDISDAPRHHCRCD